MTPEERAVINAAIKALRNRHGLTDYLRPLGAAVRALVYSCSQCNHDTHRCGGCGAAVGHGEYTCPDCEEPEIHTASTVATAVPEQHGIDLGDGGRPLVFCATCNTLAMPPHACNPDELVWHACTMKDARRGDQIRPAGSDMPNGTAVTDRLLPPDPDASDRGTWHVVPGASGKHWDDHVVQPGEVWLCLDGGAPQCLNPDFPIEILLTRAEIAAIELLGWDNRESLTTK